MGIKNLVFFVLFSSFCFGEIPTSNLLESPISIDFGKKNEFSFATSMKFMDIKSDFTYTENYILNQTMSVSYGVFDKVNIFYNFDIFNEKYISNYQHKSFSSENLSKTQSFGIEYEGFINKFNTGYFISMSLPIYETFDYIDNDGVEHEQDNSLSYSSVSAGFYKIIDPVVPVLIFDYKTNIKKQNYNTGDNIGVSVMINFLINNSFSYISGYSLNYADPDYLNDTIFTQKSFQKSIINGFSYKLTKRIKVGFSYIKSDTDYFTIKLRR